MVKHIGKASTMSPNLPGSPYYFAMPFPKESIFLTPYYINTVESTGGGMWNQKLENQFIDIQHLNQLITNQIFQL